MLTAVELGAFATALGSPIVATPDAPVRHATATATEAPQNGSLVLAGPPAMVASEPQLVVANPQYQIHLRPRDPVEVRSRVQLVRLDPTRTPDVGDAGTLVETKLGIDLLVAQRAIDRVLPECEDAWRAVGKKLKVAAKTDFGSGVLGLLGAGGAAGTAAASMTIPAVVAGAIAFVAASFSLYSQFQKKSVVDNVGLGSIYQTLSESRETLNQLNDSFKLYTSRPTLVAQYADAVTDEVKRARDVCSMAERAVAAVAPLLA
jgi:hypothetical protein